ncbi:hypothetical protein V2J09_008597, partial [Rumex salicifolius]
SKIWVKSIACYPLLVLRVGEAPKYKEGVDRLRAWEQIAGMVRKSVVGEPSTATSKQEEVVDQGAPGGGRLGGCDLVLGGDWLRSYSPEGRKIKVTGVKEEASLKSMKGSRLRKMIKKGLVLSISLPQSISSKPHRLSVLFSIGDPTLSPFVSTDSSFILYRCPIPSV